MSSQSDVRRGVGARKCLAARTDHSTAATTLSNTLGTLPVFLLGALAIFIRDELQFGETALGAAASRYLAAAVSTAPGGRLADRVGARRTMAIAATATAVSMLGIATVADNWLQLTIFMVLAGAANGIVLPATNLGLVLGIPATGGVSRSASSSAAARW